jgi:hypothetical protein
MAVHEGAYFMNIIKRPQSSSGRWRVILTGRRVLVLTIVLALVCAFAAVEAIQAQSGFGPAIGSTPPLPPAKATLLARSQQAIATARAKPNGSKPTNVAPPRVQPTATFTSGIFQEHQGPFSNSDFSIDDVYRGQVNGHWVVIYAGTTWTNFPNQGVGALRVYTVDAGLIGTFNTPDGSSNLNITGISGTTLRVVSNKGAQLTFNMVTDTFGS